MRTTLLRCTGLCGVPFNPGRRETSSSENVGPFIRDRLGAGHRYGLRNSRTSPAGFTRRQAPTPRVPDFSYARRGASACRDPHDPFHPLPCSGRTIASATLRAQNRPRVGCSRRIRPPSPRVTAGPVRIAALQRSSRVAVKAKRWKYAQHGLRNSRRTGCADQRIESRCARRHRPACGTYTRRLWQDRIFHWRWAGHLLHISWLASAPQWRARAINGRV